MVRHRFTVDSIGFPIFAQQPLSLTAQDRLSGTRVCQGHIFERSNTPSVVLSGQHRDNQSVDLMRSGRVSGAGSKPTPEMNNHSSISDLGDIDQLIFERRVAIDRFVDWNVKRDDLISAPNVVPEAIHERRVFVKQGAERGHVVRVPCSLECTRSIFRPVNVAFWDAGHGFGGRELGFEISEIN